VSGIAGLFTVWRNTRLVVMISVTAAIHAAAMIAFKWIVLLPGVTDVRPAAVFPVVFSLLFGPAAAWGAAIGNTIGDLFGSLGPGTLIGFVGNLLYGYIPHRVWESWRTTPPRMSTAGDWAIFSLAVVAASGACALIVGWGVHLLGLYPFPFVAGIILANNTILSLLLGPALLKALEPRVARLNLLYTDLAGPREVATARRLLPRAAGIALAVIALAGVVSGYSAWAAEAPGSTITFTVAPFVVGVLLMTVLL
jgi:energy-coupling factor transport system substrate-specific component